MTNDLTLLTAQDVHDKLVDIIARMPDAVNPVDDPTRERPGCVYTDAVDHGRHCIAGQFAAEQGWNLPDPGEPGGAAPHTSPGTSAGP